MRSTGFFRETHALEASPSIGGLTAPEAQPDEDHIIRYLSGGRVLVFSPGATDDVFRPHLVAGHGSVLTDGVWVWPDELAHYVRNYHVRVDPDFAAHMESSGWTVPDVAHDDLVGLAEDFVAAGLLPIPAEPRDFDPFEGLL